MNTKRADEMVAEVMNANRSHYVKLDRNAITAVLADRVQLSNTVKDGERTINKLSDQIGKLIDDNNKLSVKVNELNSKVNELNSKVNELNGK